LDEKRISTVILQLANPQPPIRNPQSTALPSPDEKAVVVRAMFDRIAPRYDTLNRLFSLRLDQYWRRVTVRTVAISARDTVDLACGTGDLSELAVMKPNSH